MSKVKCPKSDKFPTMNCIFYNADWAYFITVHILPEYKCECCHLHSYFVFVSNMKISCKILYTFCVGWRRILSKFCQVSNLCCARVSRHVDFIFSRGFQPINGKLRQSMFKLFFEIFIWNEQAVVRLLYCSMLNLVLCGKTIFQLLWGLTNVLSKEKRLSEMCKFLLQNVYKRL